MTWSSSWPACFIVASFQNKLVGLASQYNMRTEADSSTQQSIEFSVPHAACSVIHSLGIPCRVALAASQPASQPRPWNVGRMLPESREGQMEGREKCGMGEGKEGGGGPFGAWPPLATRFGWSLDGLVADRRHPSSSLIDRPSGHWARKGCLLACWLAGCSVQRATPVDQKSRDQRREGEATHTCSPVFPLATRPGHHRSVCDVTAPGAWQQKKPSPRLCHSWATDKGAGRCCIGDRGPLHSAQQVQRAWW